MNTEGRTERVSEALEAHFERCAALLNDCDGSITQNGTWGEWELKSILSLTKACTQIGSVIGRLATKQPAARKPAKAADEPPAAYRNGHVPPANGNGHTIHESRGSNPQ